MTDDFVLTATFLSVAKLAIALGFLGLFAWALEKATGLNMENAIDALEDSASKGNTLPMAIFLSAVVFTLGGILQRFQ